MIHGTCLRLLVVTSLCSSLAGLHAQGTNHLVWAEPTDGLFPARPECKGIQQSATGALYVLVQRAPGTRELAIMRSTDLGATWTRAGAALGAGSKGSMVFGGDGVTLNVLYTDNSGAFAKTHFNRFDTVTDTWLQPADTVLFQGAFHFSADDIERTADDYLLAVAETYQASPSQGIYYRVFNGTAWMPDPAVDTDGVRIDATYTSGIHAAIVLDRSLPAASSQALIYYRSGTGSYGRIETRIHLGTLVVGPEVALHGEGGGFLQGTANDRTANLQSVLRLPSGEVYMAFSANNSANSMPRVRMGIRSPAGTWTFHDVDSSSNYAHGNVDFNDVVIGLVDGAVAVYYGKNFYTGALSAQNGSGVYRKVWDSVSTSFGPEVSLPVLGQNGTFGFHCALKEPVAGLRELVVYRDNTTDQDIYAYRQAPALQVRTVISPEVQVYPAQTGIALSVTVENSGINTLSNLAVTPTFMDSSGVLVGADYSVTASPANPTTIAAAAMETLDFTVDVLPGAITGAITVGAAATADDLMLGLALADPDADTPHVWDVLACGVAVCGDCSGDTTVSILDALIAAQISAGVIAVPLLGSPQFNACNVRGIAYPTPGAFIDILDALELAQAAAGLVTLSCC